MKTLRIELTKGQFATVDADVKGLGAAKTNFYFYKK